MDFAWFIYTIALMAVTMAASATALATWVLTARRGYLVVSLGFLLYLLDVGVILFDEYARAKPLAEAYIDAGLTHPVFQVLLNAGLLGCLWLWAVMRVGHNPPRRTVAIAAAGLVGLSAVMAPEDGAGSLRFMAYWALRDLAVMAAFAWILWRAACASSVAEQADLARLRRPCLACLALALAACFEDVANIMFVRPDYSVAWVTELYWHLTERNLSENVLVILLAVLLARSARDTMRVFARHPSHDEERLAEDNVRTDFEVRLLSYADEHGLSRREREILAQVLQGRDNKNVASELVISVGTVKAHLHRIYQKAGVSGRDELVRDFWQG